MLILVRHGRTTANANGLLQGRVDNPLDEVGQAQAAAIAASLGRPDAVISSPLARARQTAAAFAAAFGVDAEIDDRWTEMDYGTWDEVPVRSVAAADWARWRADVRFAPPGGESLVELQRRVDDALASLVERAASQDVVVVCHVSPIKAAVGWALGVGPETSWRMNVAQASIHRIRTGPPGTALLGFNDVNHLASLEAG